jgi:dihydropteroate synthase
MTTATDTITQVILVGLVAGVFMAICAWKSERLASRVFLGVVAFSLLVPSAILFVGRNPWLIDARFRTFQLFYWNIRIGMSREEVMGEMTNWYPPDQPQKPPGVAENSATQLKLFITPAEADHESIILRMQDGRVIGKDYSAD